MGDRFFADIMNISVIALPSLTAGTVRNFYNCGGLKSLDFGENLASLSTNFYALASNKTGVLDTLCLRSSTMVTLAGTDWIARTPFASDGSGGTLFVPASLVSQYTQATNWSTILGYANNQILPIEGSIYETQYADGTPIITT